MRLSAMGLESRVEIMKTVWMYGGGRQSIRIATLIIQGKLPRPDIACIADTGREKARTWTYLQEFVQPNFPIPIHIVSKAKYATVDLYSGAEGDTLIIPAFTNLNGSVSKLETYCSNEWKTRVCDRWLKRDMGIKDWISWIGFSIDEPRRWKPKRKSMGDGVWFPLVDGYRQGKIDCTLGVMEHGWPEPVHSACYMCPLQSDDEWLQNDPEDQQRAIKIDAEIRLIDPNVFLHRSCVPLSEVVFKPRPKTDKVKEHCDSGLCFV